MLFTYLNGYIYGIFVPKEMDGNMSGSLCTRLLSLVQDPLPPTIVFAMDNAKNNKCKDFFIAMTLLLRNLDNVTTILLLFCQSGHTHNEVRRNEYYFLLLA